MRGLLVKEVPMLTAVSVLLVATLAFGAPPAPRSRAPLAPERIEEMLTAPTRHVRGLGDAAIDALERGARRSYTFARLLDSIERSDVLVYVETIPDLPATLAGRMMLAGSAHGLRYLRVQLRRAMKPTSWPRWRTSCSTCSKSPRRPTCTTTRRSWSCTSASVNRMETPRPSTRLPRAKWDGRYGVSSRVRSFA